MIYLNFFPAVFSFLLLAAHFYRGNQFLLMGLVILMLLLISVRRTWAARVMQAALLLGSLEWLLTTLSLVEERQAMGQPFLRLAVILAGVSVVTALSCLVFRSRRIRAHFGLGSAVAGTGPHDAA